MNAFNSLSRDHEVEAAVYDYLNNFQLPLSGSRNEARAWVGLGLRPGLSTPSLGITGSSADEAYVYDIDFQLPLSGSPS